MVPRKWNYRTMNYQHSERPCIKVTRVNGLGYEGSQTRCERSAYVDRLALTLDEGQ